MPSSTVAVISSISIATAIYISTIFSILRIPWVETHALYMHKLRLIGGKDLKCPEKFGFAHRQVSSFFLETKDSVSLHAWHVLPVGVHHKNATRLVRQSSDANFQDTLNFDLLKNDPEARLVIHTHGSSGALAAYCRSETYRALSSLASNKIHVLAFDYRGFGLSSGVPNEQGLRVDAQAVFDWAHKTAGVP
jgi:abhydrolase domain-containing protein 12